MSNNFPARRATQRRRAPEWGARLANGRDFMDMAPWLAIYPGISITLIVAGLNLLGDGLRDALAPRQQNSYR